MKKKFFQKILKMTSVLAIFAAAVTVNSTCNILVYEPKMPKSAERLVK